MVQFGPKKPDFFEEAGLLNRNLYHYRNRQPKDASRQPASPRLLSFLRQSILHRESHRLITEHPIT